MRTAPQVIAKLRRPPAVQNWVRVIRPRVDDTANSLVQFALNGPRHSLQQFYRLVADTVTYGLSDGDVWHAVARLPNALVRKLGTEILNALLPHIRTKQWAGIQVYADMVEYYPVGRNVSVPVRPTFVLLQDGKLVPYFIIGWTNLPFSHYQRRVLSTLIYEAILTLEEFRESDAMIVAVPRYPFSKSERHVVEWRVREYQILTQEERATLFDRYGRALDIATQRIIEELGE